RVGPVSHAARDEVVHAREIAVVELLESGLVPAADPLDEHLVRNRTIGLDPESCTRCRHLLPIPFPRVSPRPSTSSAPPPDRRDRARSTRTRSGAAQARAPRRPDLPGGSGVQKPTGVKNCQRPAEKRRPAGRSGPTGGRWGQMASGRRLAAAPVAAEIALGEA